MMSIPPLQFGWAEADITPESPVAITGQFHVRCSEGVESRLSATVLLLQSGAERVALVTTDTVCISDELRDGLTKRLNRSDLMLILNATHTHEGPEVRTRATKGMMASKGDGVELDLMSAEAYIVFAVERIAAAVNEAEGRLQTGSVAFGLDDAVIGRNRRWVDANGCSHMYGLREGEADSFRHIEGYEDHSLNLLATYDAEGRLVGIVVNLPSPSQEDEHAYHLGADFWSEARRELRNRFGEGLYILPQVSAAGDLTSHLIWGRKAHQRMLKLRQRSAREEVAQRIADAVGRILPVIESTREDALPLAVRRLEVDLPLNRLTQADVDDAKEQAARWDARYQEQLAAIPPKGERELRWYTEVTQAFRRAAWYRGVIERDEGRARTQRVQLDLVRLGEIAFATMPFEVYLDFGVQIKVRSPYIQTFLVQLAGAGTYLPSPRSVKGGGYGSMPASNPVGPEGGQVMVEAIVAGLRELAEEAAG